MKNEAMPVHNVLASPPTAANRNQWHFALQQIVFLKEHFGITRDFFARRLRDLSKDEELAKKQRERENILRMLEFQLRSFKLGEHIANIKKKIDNALETNQKLIDDIESKPCKDKHEDRLQQLKEDRIELNSYSQQLDDIDEQRLETSSITGLQTVEGLFSKLTERFKSFLDGVKNRRNASAFNFGSLNDGIEDDVIYDPEEGDLDLDLNAGLDDTINTDTSGSEKKKKAADGDDTDDKPANDPD